MKALKEKRISLRSLWRRGLVILSLFALVFASCSDSGGEASSGDIVEKVTLSWATPAPKQYQGTPVDLTGLVATIKYAGKAETKTITDVKRFSTEPRVVTGQYDKATGDFYPFKADGTLGAKDKTTVRVLLDGGYIENATFDAYAIELTGVAGYQEDVFLTWIKSLDPVDLADRGVYNSGLGAAKALAKDKVYADDVDFDFSGLELWATYTDGARRQINLKSDVNWMIVPDYTKTTDDKKAYKGWVYIMAGSDIDKVYDKYPTANPSLYYRYGLTWREPLATVYTVTDIAFKNDSPIADFFFWMDNTPRAWGQRLADAGGRLEVAYTSGEKKVKTIAEIIANNKIWYNNNPGDFTTDFFVYPLPYPFAKNKTDKNNGFVRVYYRGAKKDAEGNVVKIPIPIFTKLVSIGVEVNGADISFASELEVDPVRDNDIEDPGPGGNELEFSKLFTVKATYSSYNVAGATAVIPLTLAETRYESIYDLAMAYNRPAAAPVTADFGGFTLGAALPAHTTFPAQAGVLGYARTGGKLDFTAAKVEDQPTAIYPCGAYFTTDWDSVRAQILSGAKDGKSKAVKITHTVIPEAVVLNLAGPAIDQRYNYDKTVPATFGVLLGNVTSWTDDLGVTGTMSKAAKVSVKWNYNS